MWASSKADWNEKHEFKLYDRVYDDPRVIPNYSNEIPKGIVYTMILVWYQIILMKSQKA